MISSCHGAVLQWQWRRKPKQNQKKKTKTEEPNKSIKEKLNVERSHTLGNYEQG